MMNDELLEKLVQHDANLIPLVAQFKTAKEQTSGLMRIAVCGAYNAGKSTLLNMLTDALEEERFKTGAARTVLPQLDMENHPC